MIYKLKFYRIFEWIGCQRFTVQTDENTDGLDIENLLEILGSFCKKKVNQTVNKVPETINASYNSLYKSLDSLNNFVSMTDRITSVSGIGQLQKAQMGFNNALAGLSDYFESRNLFAQLPEPQMGFNNALAGLSDYFESRNLFAQLPETHIESSSNVVKHLKPKK